MVDMGSNIDAAEAPRRGARPPLAAGKARTVRIVVEENTEIPPTGLFLSHNGHAYMIKPGEEVEVPPHVIEILDHAKMSAPVIDPNTLEVLGYRERMKYPYRRVHNNE